MKGQAFVGLPSEEAAAAALRETNGYQLAGRPMVVVSGPSFLCVCEALTLVLFSHSTLPGLLRPSPAQQTASTTINVSLLFCTEK